MRKCVIFDLDGTLTQSEEGIYNCVRYAAEKLGFPLPDEDTLRKFIGPPLGYSFEYYLGMDPETVDLAVKTYRERYTTIGLFENRVYPGIRRLLRTLKNDGWYIGIATGKPQSPSERIIDHFGLSPYFDRIVGPQGSAGAEKDMLIKKALPDDYDEAWMIGDRKFDIEGGRAVGIHTIGVGYGYGSEEELRTAGCDFYAPSIQDIINYLCPDSAPPAGAFLSVEGLDGCGKTTQMDLLSDTLDRYGFEVIRSREPGGCEISEKIRQVILDPANEGMTSVTEALLYAASRAQHTAQVIRPALRSGKLLLCDRYVDSSVAYQGGGRDLGVQAILDINAPAQDGLWPTATVFLDVPHEESLRRRLNASSPDRIERESASFFARIEDAYRELIRRDPNRFICVKADRTVPEIAQEVADKVLAKLMEAEQYG